MPFYQAESLKQVTLDCPSGFLSISKDGDAVASLGNLCLFDYLHSNRLLSSIGIQYVLVCAHLLLFNQ